MDIRGYQPTSLIEWPGKIAAVVFTGGCNFRCPFCHNPDLVDPNKQAELKDYSEQFIIKDLESRKKWVDGVAVTGGEPTLQPDLIGFLKQVRRIGLGTMLETNGSRPKILGELLIKKAVDFIAMDYKTAFSDYEKAVRIRNQGLIVKKSMRMVVASGLPYEFRTTVVPTIHDEELLVKMAKDLKALIENCGLKIEDLNWVLQSFRPNNCLDPDFEKIKPFSEVQINIFLKAVWDIVPGVKKR